MLLEPIKNAIHNGVNELFAAAAVDEIAGDMDAYKKKLDTIGQIAEALGIDTEVTTITINLLNE